MKGKEADGAKEIAAPEADLLLVGLASRILTLPTSA